MHIRACTSCDSALDHCHGTLIVHTDRSVECTDAGCHDTDHSRHTFIVDCFDVAGGCGCALTETCTGPRSLAG
ncbi:hypothetical protein BJY24_002349 [Nocardia transvalensis]|uniref:Uncharacterized protein n=1 Tax=Nocardia transvalensis TaxID=37333 RepID=A0A7W9PCA6_9NOCA|nr:hypothetical protein [Nocardia transvalensis]MBB5913482.1 hypothetical protein [Nocardia transvalensis]